MLNIHITLTEYSYRFNWTYQYELTHEFTHVVNTTVLSKSDHHLKARNVISMYKDRKQKTS